MGDAGKALFDPDVWQPALEKYGVVTHLTVALYSVDERIVCGPAPPTPLFSAFERHGFDPGVFLDCARRCLAQAGARPAVVVAPSSGLAVVGASLVLDGTVVGAAVAGYALADFSQAPAIERLARQAGMPFRHLWEIARQQQPVPQRRLVLQGELLQGLGDAILRENHRTRQYEETAARLAKQMAAKDEFLAVVSHELRTPLVPILAWAAILKEEGHSPDRRRKAIDSIERNVRLQTKLVDDLLDLNRVIRDKVPLDLAIHDLRDLVNAALDSMAGAAADKGIGVELVGADEPLTVMGDAGRLQQVLVNVLSNAVKFTPAGGRVLITVGLEARAAVVRIADNGEGIEPEFLLHAFEMFRQQEQGTRRRHSGLGVGLALVRRLVELHGGSAEIASGGRGRGTEVTIRLPLSVPAAGGDPVRGAARPRRDPHPFDGLTILVVDDTADTLEATRLLLELLGADVLAASSAVEALDLLGASRPDLVLCDLRMPHMDGYEFVRELARAQGWSHPPVIAVTGLVSEADHQRTRDAGFEGHLNKPFDPAELVSAVEAALAHRRVC